MTEFETRANLNIKKADGKRNQGDPFIDLGPARCLKVAANVGPDPVLFSIAQWDVNYAKWNPLDKGIIIFVMHLQEGDKVDLRELWDDLDRSFEVARYRIGTVKFT